MKCKASVPGFGGWRLVQCENNAKYGDYCGVHSPEKQAERAKARGPTRYERDCASRKRERERVKGLEALNDALVQALYNFVCAASTNGALKGLTWELEQAREALVAARGFGEEATK